MCGGGGGGLHPVYCSQEQERLHDVVRVSYTRGKTKNGKKKLEGGKKIYIYIFE